MSLDEAIRLTEILVGLAFAQQSIEHFQSQWNEQRLFIVRFILSILLIAGFQSGWIVALLLIVGLLILYRFQGPYNGGSDRMGLLILCSLCFVHFAPSKNWQEIAFGYLAIQLILSYFMSGWIKIVNPDWRNGRALRDVFQYSIYPVSESLRNWSKSKESLLFASWLVMLFELFFPFSLLSPTSLILALVIAAGFHLSNACFLGLNRFFWIWIAAYPSIIWFQLRIFT